MTWIVTIVRLKSAKNTNRIWLMAPLFMPGVDYEKILRQAEQEVDIILWDGGNNDFPFYVSNLQIVVADPHRPGHEIGYHPGETNARCRRVRHQQGGHRQTGGHTPSS